MKGFTVLLVLVCLCEVFSQFNIPLDNVQDDIFKQTGADWSDVMNLVNGLNADTMLNTAVCLADKMWLFSTKHDTFSTEKSIEIMEQGFVRTGWKAPINAGVALFNDHLYVLGGRIYEDGEPVVVNEIWRTSIENDWEQVVSENNQWSAREGHKAFVWNNKLCVLGGKDSIQYNGDLWCSLDAVNWELIHDNVITGRSNFGLEIMGSRIIVAGGSSAAGITLDDVLVSNDGITFERIGTLPEPLSDLHLLGLSGDLAIVGGRRSMTARGCPFNNKLYASGNQGSTWKTLMRLGSAIECAHVTPLNCQHEKNIKVLKQLKTKVDSMQFDHSDMEVDDLVQSVIEDQLGMDGSTQLGLIELWDIAKTTLGMTSKCSKNKVEVHFNKPVLDSMITGFINGVVVSVGDSVLENIPPQCRFLIDLPPPSDNIEFDFPTDEVNGCGYETFYSLDARVRQYKLRFYLKSNMASLIALGDEVLFMEDTIDCMFHNGVDPSPVEFPLPITDPELLKEVDVHMKVENKMRATKNGGESLMRFTTFLQQESFGDWMFDAQQCWASPSSDPLSLYAPMVWLIRDGMPMDEYETNLSRDYEKEMSLNFNPYLIDESLRDIYEALNEQMQAVDDEPQMRQTAADLLKDIFDPSLTKENVKFGWFIHCLLQFCSVEENGFNGCKSKFDQSHDKQPFAHAFGSEITSTGNMRRLAEDQQVTISRIEDIISSPTPTTPTDITIHTTTESSSLTLPSRLVSYGPIEYVHSNPNYVFLLFVSLVGITLVGIASGAVCMVRRRGKKVTVNNTFREMHIAASTLGRAVTPTLRRLSPSLADKVEKKSVRWGSVTEFGPEEIGSTNDLDSILKPVETVNVRKCTPRPNGSANV